STRAAVCVEGWMLKRVQHDGGFLRGVVGGGNWLASWLLSPPHPLSTFVILNLFQGLSIHSRGGLCGGMDAETSSA
ncbi:hypothetical protein, partial [Novosphingobium sp.]|uniref:hypothetical protein n=1 Tax=Novosphingobium sp. TaxID=1874826 RepID=UPI003564AE78